MASSSHVRSRADRKTHMVSVPSCFARQKVGPSVNGPTVICGTFLPN